MRPSTLFVLLPLGTYVLLVLRFARKKTIAELLNAIGKSHLLFFAFVAVSTETLSAFRSIHFPHVLGTWMVLSLGCALTVGLKKLQREGFALRETFSGISPVSAILV